MNETMEHSVQLIDMALYVMGGFTILITLLFGFLPSYSESYYKLGEWKKFGWLFSLVLLVVGVLLVFAVQHYLIAFSMCGIWFVAFVPNFKDKVANGVHYTFAVLIFIPALIYLWSIGFWIIVVASAIAVGLSFFISEKYRVFVVEFILIFVLLFTLRVYFS